MQASNEVRYLVDGIAVSSMHKVKLSSHRNYTFYKILYKFNCVTFIPISKVRYWL
jgi:hypothetical protein